DLHILTDHYPSPDHLAHTTAGSGIHVTRQDAGQRLQRSLDLHRINLHPGDVHHATQPAVQVQVSVRVDVPEVARPKETVMEDAPVPFRLANIAGHYSRRAHGELA